jgi:copper(I)-binding protein
MRAGLIAFAVLALALASAAQAAPVLVSDAVIHPAPKGLPVTAAYMTLANPGARPVALTGASCGCAASVAAHESVEHGHMMHMQPAGPVMIAAHGKVTFKPGGLHLMVMGLKRDIRPGDRVPMTLHFGKAGTQTVMFTAGR